MVETTEKLREASSPSSEFHRPGHNARSYFGSIKYHLVSTLKGMKVTWKHFIQSGKGNEKRAIYTYQYPDEGMEAMAEHVAERHRGMIYLEPSKCIMCYACSKVCPAQCIVIEGVRLKSDNYMTRFTVDNSKCIFCGLCTEVCPSDCIHHGREWDYSAFKREGLVRDLLRGTVFTPADYLQSKTDLEQAKVIEENFKKEQDALKAAAKAAKAPAAGAAPASA